MNARRCAKGLSITLGAVLALTACMSAQDGSSSREVLLSRAATMAERGRLDLAAADWRTVVATDANNTEALAGLLRVAVADGRKEEAAKLRKTLASLGVQPESVSARVPEQAPSAVASSLEKARLLTAQGDDTAALALYRTVYGPVPPPGEAALTVYRTQARVPSGRSDAVAGLRALCDRYPDDARYPRLLGEILSSEDRTRAEGQALLDRFGSSHFSLPTTSPQGQQAVGLVPPPSGIPTQSTVAASISSPASVKVPGAAIPNSRGPEGLTAQSLSERVQPITATPAGPGSTRDAAEQAEQRLKQGRYLEARSLLVDAQMRGDRSVLLVQLLARAENGLQLHRAAELQQAAKFEDAVALYREVLQASPTDPSALKGMGDAVFASGDAAHAVPYFAKRVSATPSEASAWRDLALAQAAAGLYADAITTDEDTPATARQALVSDRSYLRALWASQKALGHTAEAEALHSTFCSLPGQAISGESLGKLPVPGCATAPDQVASVTAAPEHKALIPRNADAKK